MIWLHHFQDLSRQSLCNVGSENKFSVLRCPVLKNEKCFAQKFIHLTIDMSENETALKYNKDLIKRGSMSQTGFVRQIIPITNWKGTRSDC